MRLNELRDTSYEIAKSKGWHDAEFEQPTFGDQCALIISELAEALEEYRMGHSPSEIRFPKASADAPLFYLDRAREGIKPEGVIVELADAAIRIGHYAGYYEVDLERDFLPMARTVAAIVDYATERELTFGEHMCAVAVAVVGPQAMREQRLCGGLMVLGEMVRGVGISGTQFEQAIEIKHAYNRTRPHRHGGKLL